MSSSSLFAEDFRIILFPDTQNMTVNSGVPGYNNRWPSMYNWVIANKTSSNIQAVIGLGDVVGALENFPIAMTGYNALMAVDGLVVFPAIGNHDYDDEATYDATTWNSYFPTTYFSAESWYGGAKNNETTNWYAKFTVDSFKFLVLGLEYIPRFPPNPNEVITWAQGILNANSDHKIIIVTHAYLNNDGTRLSTGTIVWNNLVYNYPQVILVVCGHLYTPPTTYALSYNAAGKQIPELRMDYQGDADGGSGYMGILTFQPDQNRIVVTAYSDWLEQYDGNVNYELPFDGTVPSVIRSGVWFSGGTLK